MYMTTFWQEGTTVARHLRVKGAGLDPTLTQLHVTSLLNAADIQPAGLMPSAIVCIRTLRTSRHVPLSLQHGGGRPPHAWEQSLNASLEEMIRHAARPILGPVPANSEAVVFNDTAELLACMTTDWCEGLLPARWWWKSLFKTSDVTSLILPTWLNAPAYVPVALQHLAVRRLAIPFVRSLSSDNARLLLQKIIHTFSLYTLYQTLYTSENDTAINTFDNHTTAADNQKDITFPPNDTEGKQAETPWQHIVPESQHTTLNLDQQCLVGIALMLQRASATVRTRAFAEAVQRWRHTYTTITGNQTVGSQFVAPTTMPTTPHPAQKTPYPAFEHNTTSTINDQTGGSQFVASTPTRTPELGPLPTDAYPTSKHEQEQIQQEAPNNGLNTVSGQPVDQQQTAMFTPETQTTMLPPETHIDTAFGGLFYLINLALFLDLYGDFTSPMHKGIELPIWDFIALLGQRLLGEDIKQDPIWSLLAQLAERDVQDAPGKDFTPPAEWHIPVDWLEAELEQSGIREDLYQWLNWLMPHIYARLQRALNLDSKEQIAPMLCVHAAHVSVTATHLDIFLSLDTLPIEIRLAGLDRNPGWVPAAGRFITFHFS
jgi:hypothetical protein